MDQGVPPDQILKRILESRQLTQRFKTPTPEEAARDVERMVREAENRRR
jgi:hypothetical protein